MKDQAIRDTLERMAADVGRLRRGLPPGTSLVHAVDRLACCLETLDAIMCPTAAELAGQTAPGDPDAIREALRIVDTRARAFRQKLGAS